MAQVTVSENEVEVAVAKALSGLDVPAGLDREAGKIAAMAITGGLDDGTQIEHGISRTAAWGHRSPEVISEDGEVTLLDAGERSALTLGLPILEFAFSLAPAEPGAPVQVVDVDNLGEPLLLAGALCRLARLGRPALAGWQGSDESFTCLAASADSCDGARWETGDGPEGMRPAPGRVRLRAASAADAAGVWPAFNADPLDSLADWLAHRRDRLAEGLQVPWSLWNRMKAYGKLTLVPETSTEARRG